MKATILYLDGYKTTRDQRFDATAVASEGKLLDPQCYSKITSVDCRSTSVPQALEELFEKFNIGDRGGVACRSMSVADVVQIQGEQYVCAPMGWKRVEMGPVIDESAVDEMLFRQLSDLLN